MKNYVSGRQKTEKWSQLTFEGIPDAARKTSGMSVLAALRSVSSFPFFLFFGEHILVELFDQTTVCRFLEKKVRT